MMFDISETETLLKNTVAHLTELTEQYEDICIDDEEGQELAARHLRAIEKAARRVVALDGILVELKQKPVSLLASPASQSLLGDIKRWCEEWMMVEVQEADYA